MGHRMKAYPERLRHHLRRKNQQNATLESTDKPTLPTVVEPGSSARHEDSHVLPMTQHGNTAFIVAGNSKSSTEEDQTMLTGVGENERALTRHNDCSHIGRTAVRPVLAASLNEEE